MNEKENIFNLIRKRQSIRAFQKRDVEPEKIDRILTSVITAPSAGNLQAYRIYEIRNDKTRYDLSKAAYDQLFISAAPVCLVFCADKIRSGSHYGSRGTELYSIQDATIASVYAMLAAEALELGTVWIGAFNEIKVSEVLELKNDLFPVAILPIGYPAEVPGRTGRRELNEILVRIV